MITHTGWLFFYYKQSSQSIYEEKLPSVPEQRPPMMTFWVQGAQYHIALHVTDMILSPITGENWSV